MGDFMDGALELKLTQSRFAELVNLSEDSIGKIERGASVPTISTLKQIAEALKISLSELLEEAPAKEKSANKDANKAMDDLVKYLKTRPIEDIKLIHELAIKILER
ncbi:MAG: helix-turn-helix transcriptional regulator [Deltaproteobacteria bacterium]